MILDNIFFEKLPEYFKVNDTYKDAEGKGILERFLSIFGVDLDEITLPLLENTTDILNPEKSVDLLNQILNPTGADNGKFLNHIAYGLNNPIDVLPDEAQYRKLLSFVITLYKLRGTKLAIRYWGYLIGIPLEVVEINTPRLRCDDGYQYDSNIITSESTIDPARYDSACLPCSEYFIIVENSIQE